MSSVDESYLNRRGLGSSITPPWAWPNSQWQNDSRIQKCGPLARRWNNSVSSVISARRGNRIRLDFSRTLIFAGFHPWSYSAPPLLYRLLLRTLPEYINCTRFPPSVPDDDESPIPGQVDDWKSLACVAVYLHVSPWMNWAVIQVEGHAPASGQHPWHSEALRSQGLQGL